MVAVGLKSLYYTFGHKSVLFLAAGGGSSDGESGVVKKGGNDDNGLLFSLSRSNLCR